MEVEADTIAGIAHAFEPRHGLVINVRHGSEDDRPNLEAALRRFLCLVAQPFPRVAVVVGTHAAMHRMARLTRDLVDKPLLTLNAAHADEFASGLKDTSVRRRAASLESVWAEAPAEKPPTERPGADRGRRVPTDFPFPRDSSSPPPSPSAAPARKGKSTSRRTSGEDLASAFVIDQIADDAGALATELDRWAMVREKVIDKLDIRGARAARGIARELRGARALLEGARLEGDRPDAGIGVLYAEMRALVAKGESLMKAPAAVIDATSPWVDTERAPKRPSPAPATGRRSRNPSRPSRRASAPATAARMSRATRRPR